MWFKGFISIILNPFLRVFAISAFLKVIHAPKTPKRGGISGTPKITFLHCNPLQGQYRVEFTTQGKPCSHYREPLFSLQGPCIHHRESCIHYREFPVRITTQGNPCNHYREWVCSEHDMLSALQKQWMSKKAQTCKRRSNNNGSVLFMSVESLY